MRKIKKQYIIPIFVPHLGCPNDCIFCNQKSISGQKKQITKEETKKIIDNYLESIENEDAKIEIAFYGGSFTAIEKEKQEQYDIENVFAKRKKKNKEENPASTGLVVYKEEGFLKKIFNFIKRLFVA